jgi:hypothetical protein
LWRGRLFSPMVPHRGSSALDPLYPLLFWGLVRYSSDLDALRETVPRLGGLRVHSKWSASTSLCSALLTYSVRPNERDVDYACEIYTSLGLRLQVRGLYCDSFALLTVSDSLTRRIPHGLAATGTRKGSARETGRSLRCFSRPPSANAQLSRMDCY